MNSLFVGNALRLGPGSPCMDAGCRDALPSAVTTDIDGNARFANDPADN